MKSSLMVLQALLLFLAGRSQEEVKKDVKPIIDSVAIKTWTSVRSPGISNNGKYAFYAIDNYPVGLSTLIVKSTNKLWEKQFVIKGSGQPVLFSADNKSLLFKNNDTLFSLTLGTDSIAFKPNIFNFKQPNVIDEWIAYQQNDFDKRLTIRNLVSGKELHFYHVNDFAFNHKGNGLLLKVSNKQNNLNCDSLYYADLNREKVHLIWANDPKEELHFVKGFSFDKNGEQITFIIQEGKKNIGCKIGYYKIGTEKAIMILSDSLMSVKSALSIDNSNPEFSSNGLYIYFKLKSNFPIPNDDKNNSNLNIWSYTDIVLHNGKNEELPERFIAIFNVASKHVVRIEEPCERIVDYRKLKLSNVNYAVVVEKNKDLHWWKDSISESHYLVSLKDGRRKLIKRGMLSCFEFSPDGKYLVYFDDREQAYLSLDIETSKITNISKHISSKLNNEYRLYIPGRTFPQPVGIAGWIKRDKILVYDNFDIWQLDAEGKDMPINITNGYGKSTGIKFRVVYEQENLTDVLNQSSLLLTAFNTKNKHNGFYSKKVGIKGNPILLTMGAYLLFRNNFTQIPNIDVFDLDGGMKPLKAANEDVWIVKKQSAVDVPNYFLTRDFKRFESLSDIQPQIKYNWLKSELLSWRQLDGTISQGILYKPENFDSNKKYPVIFHFYEAFSYRLYETPVPSYSVGRLNIPWFVSRGYLVFTPDIHYSIANVSGKVIGDCAVNSIVSAAKHLATIPYVDITRMGIQGHSFSGFQTNYVITKTNLFAAAVEASGTSNSISSYLNLVNSFDNSWVDKQMISEIGQGRFGATLWQRKDLYIKSSPVLNAEKVRTPLLIMHNPGDAAVSWEQGVEMFMALRRLEKKVWMLQYSGATHTLNGKNAIDYTIRMTQFFNYFLKGEAIPIWMTSKIDPNVKSTEVGWQYEK